MILNRNRDLMTVVDTAFHPKLREGFTDPNVWSDVKVHRPNNGSGNGAAAKTL